MMGVLAVQTVVGGHRVLAEAILLLVLAWTACSCANW